MSIQSFAFCYLAKVVVYSYFHRLGNAQSTASFTPFMVVPADNVQSLVGIGPTFSTSHELCCNLPPRTQQHRSLQLRWADFRWADFSFSISMRKGESLVVSWSCAPWGCVSRQGDLGSMPLLWGRAEHSALSLWPSPVCPALSPVSKGKHLISLLLET